MRCSSEESGDGACSSSQKKYKGVRQRKWGKWVSEIRVPGSQERLWLGSYATPEAAAVARDVAFYCLRGPSALDYLNFPLMLPHSVRNGMSPRSVQKAASDAGMAIDAQLIAHKLPEKEVTREEKSGAAPGLETDFTWENVGDNSRGTWEGSDQWKEAGDQAFSISVEDYL
ncbi:ethylene-responsive transcription factor ERF020 [Juglans microcarpa x Juglans regia]|uniref:ethylene-responsive transcription factor ERF020 n=1 Tax=Juglans microcarpa x Juglans regia TaxID=2249226 RepID=UPI001B7E983E|nr:ethylene-responsive transcription factor ERF020 [Juglans microcarpa x Juglans regia]